MTNKRKLFLICFLSLAALIVLVNQISRMVGGIVADFLPPLFAIGTAALCGRYVRRKMQEERDREP